MTSNLPIYLDYHATTPVDPRVAEVVLHAMTITFGNPNSVEHVYGEIALVEADQDSKNHNLTHRSVLDALAFHERKGEVSVRWLPVDNQARLNLEGMMWQSATDAIFVMISLSMILNESVSG